MANIKEIGPEFLGHLRRSARAYLRNLRWASMLYGAVGACALVAQDGDTLLLFGSHWQPVAMRWSIAAAVGLVVGYVITQLLYAAWLPAFTSHVLTNLRDRVMREVLKPFNSVFDRIKEPERKVPLANTYFIKQVTANDSAELRVRWLVRSYQFICQALSVPAYPSRVLNPLYITGGSLFAGLLIFSSLYNLLTPDSQTMYLTGRFDQSMAVQRFILLAYVELGFATMYLTAVIPALMASSLRLATVDYVLSETEASR